MLNERIKSRILDDHKELLADGKLPSNAQLDGYYRIFRSRFGPDVLASLDGEDLLETMHSLGTKDSLVYWLEFKNDEEFPARIFGSIAGSSAFKFGIFRRKETGTWVTTDGAGTRPGPPATLPGPPDLAQGRGDPRRHRGRHRRG